MPTYEYRCDSCGRQIEAVQSFTDPPLTDCPNCEHGKLRKLFGNVGVVFRGSGFYRNDARAERSGKSKGDDEGKSGESASAGDSSQPSQPPAKSGDGAAAKPAGSSGEGGSSGSAPKPASKPTGESAGSPAPAK